MKSLRNWTIVILAVMVCAGAMILSAVASPVDVRATYNEQDGRVTISGQLSSEAGKLVSLQVINPLNQLDLLDQTAIGADGSYQFSYVLKQKINGTYFVNVNVEQSTQVLGTTFEVSVISPPTPTPTPSIPPTPTPDPTPDSTSSDSDDSSITAPQPSTGQPVVKSTPHVVVDQTGAIVSAKLDKEAVDKVFSAGDSHLVVEIQPVKGARQYQLYAPASMFLAAAEQKMTIVTELGSITIPNGLLSNVDIHSATELGFVIASADRSSIPDEMKGQIGQRPVLELSILVDGKPVNFNNPSKSVAVTIPYQPTEEELKNPEHIVVWYIDHAGEARAVPSGKYEASTGTVTFKTTHFSTFAVGYQQKSFADLSTVEWARKPIEVMASKGIISGTSDTLFQPAVNMNRADFMILLTKSFDFNADVTTNFRDVHPIDYYYEAVGIAKQLGLAEGQEDGTFHPNEQISRQDMMVLLARAMGAAGMQIANGAPSDLEAFSDKSHVASYAVNHIAALMKSGFVEGSGSMLNPTGYATRAEAAVMLYRIYNKQQNQNVVPDAPDIYFER
ncbi:S-layer homology domain-containing protein [Paenibacillus sp. CGMCC 1.16610]|uniref:S-layer homology domain-containing protein n=1 Tax=Paenibacillus TaxID=44249 RepID=UPI0015EF0219|nr:MULTISPECIES: S-layer homology domain-containing protein [Paenibacillus]MBA2942621.1 S-layer homology domain-containing protein [Paenibacillus sp. CGMCC 1.16610]